MAVHKRRKFSNQGRSASPAPESRQTDSAQYAPRSLSSNTIMSPSTDN
jgi:hypothetical protein